jgi:lipoprotein-anchoring transpeptidase ErfK/SrfK
MKPLLLLALCSGALGAAQPALSASAVEQKVHPLPLLPQSAGPAVVRAQIRVHRLHLSTGEIDGRYGANMQRAVEAFQRMAGIPVSGAVDAATWKALERDPAPPLIAYPIGYQDIAGPFAKIPADMLAKAKLQYLGYESPLEALAEKLRSSQELLQQLNPGVAFKDVGQVIAAPNLPAEPLRPAARLVISKESRTLTVYDDASRLLAHYPVSIGGGHDPLPAGTMRIMGTRWYPQYHYDPRLYWDAKPGQARATLPPGPNSPVGVVWIELSRDHLGIHGTPEPSRIAIRESHGCVNLANWDAIELGRSVTRKTVVTVREK